MGSYARLLVDGYSLCETKNAIDPIVMTIFRESDRRCVERKYSEVYGEEPEEGGSTVACIAYANTAGNIRQRLDVMGFSLAGVERDFQAAKGDEIERLVDAAEDGQFAESYLEDKKFFERLSLEAFISAFEEIRKRGLYAYRFHEPTPPDCTPLIHHILEDEDMYFGFPSSDIRFFLRAFLETCTCDALVEEDISDLVHSGYCDPDETVCENALRDLTEDYPSNEKIIVLTEGSTDKTALEGSLALLYPHLREYYTFMDFGIVNAGGGAGFLVSTIKAFAGAGISNRTIALFDNDTAAHEAMRGLPKTAMPPNIKVMAFPPIEIARRYPTLGPGGVSEGDINGMACSIELYMGRDVLTGDSGLTPVQWRGLMSGTGDYQGEILDKKRIHRAFTQKLDDCTRDPAFVGKTDWSGMRAILEAMFGLFQ